MSGNPAAQSIHAYLVTTVTVRPENVDLVGLEHPFWPGNILLDVLDYGARPKEHIYKDGPVEFVVTMIRVAIGEVHDNVSTFDSAYETMFRLLRAGQDRTTGIERAVHEVLDSVKADLEPKLPEGHFGDVVASIDSVEKDLTRKRRTGQ